MKKYIVSCDPVTEDPIMYTFVYDWVEVKLDKNISRKKKIERILIANRGKKDYSMEWSFLYLGFLV